MVKRLTWIFAIIGVLSQIALLASLITSGFLSKILFTWGFPNYLLLENCDPLLGKRFIYRTLWLKPHHCINTVNNYCRSSIWNHRCWYRKNNIENQKKVNFFDYAIASSSYDCGAEAAEVVVEDGELSGCYSLVAVVEFYFGKIGR